ncbi:MAG TPA: sugar transferase [Dongiaceae bacterium]|nr:sugar transferase [Dongiaceae bacterium]
MSSLLINPQQRRPQLADYARLIPGESPASGPKLRKPPQSVRPFGVASVENSRAVPSKSERGITALLVPRPLLTRTGWDWLRCVLTDCTLITLNWLLLRALLLDLGAMFPSSPALIVAGGANLIFGLCLLHAVLVTLLGYSEGLYAADLDVETQRRILGKAILLAGVLMCFTDGLQGPWPVGVLIGSASASSFLTLLLWRSWSSRRANGVAQVEARNVLVVGAGAVGQRIAAYIEQHPACARRFCGFLDDEELLGNEVIGRISDLAQMARRGFVDEVILAGACDAALAVRVIREAKRLRLDLEIVPELFGCDPAQEEIESVGGLPVICVHAERLPAVGLVVKRAIDIVGASFGLLVLAPVLAAIALLIRMESRGPVLYVAKRAGRKGRTFNCYKFRTMVIDADQRKDELRKRNQREGPIFKIFDDPRITRLGRHLRRYSLDELPQLWNVLKGEMSLVGPRPHPVDEFEAYELSHLARLDVTPGLTGLWQISARRDASFERAMELDREYIRTWNLRLDLRILLRTVRVVVSGSGN